MNKVINFTPAKSSCAVCGISELCLPHGISKTQWKLLDDLVQQEYTINKGEYLFYAGQSLKSMFAVHSGSIKTFILSNEGDEQILGFQMPGDILGFDALGHDVYSCSAVALETSSVCVLPVKPLQELCAKVPALGEHVMALMSNEIGNQQEMMLTLAKKSAEARIAALLMSISNRFYARGFSANHFHLSMSRHDIGNYLGLAVETVSRLLTHLHEVGIIMVDRRYIKILDMPRLRKLAQLGEINTPHAKQMVD